MPKVLIVGCGYLGKHLAQRHRARGDQVRCLVRRAESAAAVAGCDWDTNVVDLDDPAALHAVLPARVDRVYYLVPPPPTGETDPRLAAFLAGDMDCDRLVYVSTTGVYGDCGGAWVDETRTPDPQSARARRRLGAEHRLHVWARERDTPAAILRAPGIYGPGRLPLANLRQGRPVIRDSESPYLNRIHVEDLATACLAAGQPDRPGGPYNVSDGEPTTMRGYYERLADLAGLPRPPVLPLAEARRHYSDMAWSFLRESRRIDNRRMRRELGVTPAFDLERGLRQALEAAAR